MIAGMSEQPADNVGVVAGVIGLLGHGAFAEIEVAGEAGDAGAMLGRGPERVVALRIAVGAGEPLLVGLGSGGGVLVYLADHGGEKRRLGTREVVRAVCIEDGAVVGNLEEEVFDHASREIAAAVVFEAEEDEVAVHPYISLKRPPGTT